MNKEKAAKGKSKNGCTLFRVICVLCILVVLTACSVCGVYAKYVDATLSDSTAGVARMGVEKFNLLEHIADDISDDLMEVAKSGTLYKLRSGTNSSDLVPAGSEKNTYSKVIPGIDIPKDPFIELEIESNEVSYELYVKIEVSKAQSARDYKIIIKGAEIEEPGDETGDDNNTEIAGADLEDENLGDGTEGGTSGGTEGDGETTDGTEETKSIITCELEDCWEIWGDPVTTTSAGEEKVVYTLRFTGRFKDETGETITLVENGVFLADTKYTFVGFPTGSGTASPDGGSEGEKSDITQAVEGVQGTTGVTGNVIYIIKGNKLRVSQYFNSEQNEDGTLAAIFSIKFTAYLQQVLNPVGSDAKGD